MLDHPDFARAAVNRVWAWIFGRGIVHEPGRPPPRQSAGQPRTARLRSPPTLVRSGYDFRKLCRTIVSSAAYRAASGSEAAEAHFAAYPIRRIDAEVLDDALRQLSGVPSTYSSVIPEPFTFLPENARTVTIADGSISSSFLILFGRPARDSGSFSERNNAITGKQRLWLFNSGEIYRKLGRIPQRPELKKLPFPRKVEELYWLFLLPAADPGGGPDHPGELQPDPEREGEVALSAGPLLDPAEYQRISLSALTR